MRLVAGRAAAANVALTVALPKQPPRLFADRRVMQQILSELRKDEIQERLSLAMISEAVLCLQEGIVSCARDGDIGAVFGLGFPPFTGGPFRYIDLVGAQTVVDRMKRLEDRFGVLYSPPRILADMAKKGGRFRAEK